MAPQKKPRGLAAFADSFSALSTDAAQQRRIEEQDEQIETLERQLQALQEQLAGLEPDSSASDSGVVEIPLDQIVVPDYQPRTYINPEKLERLAESIRQYGVRIPVMVRPSPDRPGLMELVAGLRRYLGSRQADRTTVRALVETIDDETAVHLAVLENAQREDLNPLDETDGILHLLSVALGLERAEVIRLFQQSQTLLRQRNAAQDTGVLNEGPHAEFFARWQAIEQLFASAIGRFSPESFRTHRLPLLDLPEDIRTALREERIAYSKARIIGRIIDEQPRRDLLERAIAEGWVRSRVQEEVAKLRGTADPAPELRQQFDAAIARARAAGVWKHPEKRDRLKALLSQLDALLDES